MQVFYAAFQALLYALCYYLEGLLVPAPDGVSAAASALGRIQLPSSEAPSPPPRAAASQREQDGAGVRQLFSEVIPQLLNHRCAG